MRCKVRCESITESTNGHSVQFFPVSGGSKENEQFFKYTPSGDIRLSIVNPAVVEQLKVGAQYYVDFTPVE